MRSEFAAQLTRLREHAGLTVRQVADKTGALGAHSTMGDWFAGRGLPSTSSRELLIRVLTVCGVEDGADVDAWLRAWRRVRLPPGRRPASPEPYRGLASYEPEHAAWFFGRGALVSELLAACDAATGTGGMLVVVGASGAGKSSLLRAGLIPAVRAGSTGWPVVLLTPGERPSAALAAADRPGRPRLIVVDQFEELFATHIDPAEREQFIATLSAAATGPDRAVVVVALRADFYGHALRHPDLHAAVRRGQFVVGPMSEPELREVIVEPARMAGLEVGEGLTDLLLREMTPPAGGGTAALAAGGLPLLSYALYATWRHSRDRRLTVADYQAIGRIDGAVAASAERVYGGLTTAQRELARDLFLSLVHVADDTADTRRRLAMADLTGTPGRSVGEELVEVLDRFVAQRLITVDDGTVQISHEALLTAWPRLRSWLDGDRAGLVVGRRLAESAAAWAREDRDPAALHTGGRLVVARDWLSAAGGRGGVPPLVAEFVAASLRREDDLRRRDRRRTRRLRLLAAGFATMFVLAAVAAGGTVRSLATVRDERDAAISAKVGNEATAVRPANPALAAQLSLAAFRLAPTAEARGSLLSTVANPYATQVSGHVGAVYDAEFSPDGRVLATAGTDRTLRLWNVRERYRPTLLSTVDTGGGVLVSVFSPDGRTLATGGADRVVRMWDVRRPDRPRLVATLAGHGADVRGAAFSRDGRVLATASYDRTVRLWNVSDPARARELSVLPGAAGGVTAAVFTPDGRTLAATSEDGTVRLWDVRERRRPVPLGALAGHTDRVLAAAMSPDGRLLATGSFDNVLRLWRLDGRRPVQAAALTGHQNGVVAVAFSPDGRTVATGSYDQTVRLWDVTDLRYPAEPLTLPGHAEVVYSVAFSPDGRTLASASRDNTARIWDLHGRILSGHHGPVHAAALSPDGRLLAATSYQTVRLWGVRDLDGADPVATLTGYDDNVLMASFNADGTVLATADNLPTARLWSTADPAHPVPLAQLPADSANVFTVAFSPDGRALATGGSDTTVRLWSLSGGRPTVPPVEIPGHTDRVLTAAFSPDGRTLASGGADHTVRLWDVHNRQQPTPLATVAGHGGAVEAVAFSPDGQTLASGGADHTAQLWDLTDPRRPARTAVLTGHGNAVSAVAFSPDGRLLATGSFDGTVALREVTDRRPGPPVMLRGHTGRVNTVAFGRDGGTVLSGGDDTTVRIWDTDPDRVVERICRIAHPRLTAAQWRQYFPGLAYRPPCP